MPTPWPTITHGNNEAPTQESIFMSGSANGVSLSFFFYQDWVYQNPLLLQTAHSQTIGTDYTESDH